jgi:O-antigen ligase
MHTLHRYAERVHAWRLLTLASLVVAIVRGNGIAVQVDLLLTAAQFGLLALALVVVWLTPHDLQQRRTWVAWAAVALVAFAAVSAFWSPIPGTTVSRAALFLLLLAFAFESSRVRWADRAVLQRDMLLLFAVTAAFFGIALILAMFSVPGTWGDYFRFRGFTANATVAGWIAVMVFPLGYDRILETRGRTRLLFAAGGAVLIATVIASGTRGALIGLFVAVLIVHVLRRSGWVVGAITIAVVAAGTALTLFGPSLEAVNGVAPAPEFGATNGPTSTAAPAAPAVDPGPLVGRVTESRTDISSGRLDLWHTGIDLWQQKPVGGWGFGSTHVLPGLKGGLDMSMHNAYISSLLELGVVGALLFVGLLAAVFSGRKLRDRPALVAAAAIVLLNGLFESSLINLGSPVTTLAWLILAATLASGRRELLPEPEDLSRYRPVVAAVD